MQQDGRLPRYSFAVGAHSRPLAFAFDPATAQVIISHTDEQRQGWITLFHTQTRMLSSAMQVRSSMIFSIAPVAGLSRCAAVGPGTSGVDFINLNDSAIQQTIPLRGYPYWFLADQDTGTLFVLDAVQGRNLTNTVAYTIDSVAGIVRNSVSLGQSLGVVAINSMRRILFVANSRTSSLSRVDGRIGVLLEAVALPAPPQEICVDEQVGRLFIPTTAGLLVLGNSGEAVDYRLSAEHIYGASEGGVSERGMGLDAAAHRLVLGHVQGGGDEALWAVTVLDTRSWEVVHRYNLPGRVQGVFTHRAKHHTYVLYHLEDGSLRPRLSLQVLNTYTGTILHDEIVSGNPRNFLLVESLNQLFIADWDAKAVVCVEDRIPASVDVT
jgi:hypothetical protein